MSAELLRQKELENLHRQRLLAGDPLSLHPGLPPDHPALRSVHDVPEGHALRDELSRRNAMLVLRHNNAPLLSLTPGGPGAATPPKEQPRRAGGGRKSSQPRAEPQGPGEAREPRARDGAQDCNDEEMKDSESDAEAGEDKARGPRPRAARERSRRSARTARARRTMGGLFLDGEESPALEDISKWTVEDVCSFVSNLSGCTEYTQVFREQAIDGETLPLLTEEHLLNNMGLKLGPALKIRSQVAKRLGRVLCMAGFPVALPGLRPPEREAPAGELRPASTGSVASPFGGAVPGSRGSPKQENGNAPLLSDTPKPPS
ncbi:hypothetical protein DUI87_31815 [Hirundo rustica rustica]|uniref:SAM domain-containing protein n=1 Tax=Hirundo rustica rustica TaxID=333673 RepID=A0A3M0JAB0_HIRRU|nr:hypothetical protein DUI87_31815 [Hirundo rustica rustica]